MVKDTIKNVKPGEKHIRKVRDKKKKMVDVVYSIRPVTLFEYFFGIFRFHLVNEELRLPNWIMKMVSLLLIGTFLTLFIAFFKFPAVISGTANIVDTMEEIPSIAILLQYATTVISACFVINMANIRILDTFVDIDNMLQVEAINDFYKKSRKESNIYLIILVATHVVNVIVDIVTSDEIIIKGIVVLPVYFVQQLEIVVFSKYIAMIKNRLATINSYITTFVQVQDKKYITVFAVADGKVASEEKFNFIGRASDSNTRIRDLATTFDCIGRTCSMVNEIFNFQIFMTLVSTFMYVVITIWTSLHYYKSAETNSGPVINITVWCISTINTVAVMSIACEQLLIIRNKTKILINKIIMNYDLPKTMRVQAKAFIELVEAWPLNINIYDMFSVDITLMLKFISVATTYLIVIIKISNFI